MKLLSREFEQALKLELLNMVNKFLELQLQNKRQTGLISLEAVKEELEVSTATLKRWEGAGLRRYQPPLEDSRKSYYLIKDIHIFMAIDG